MTAGSRFLSNSKVSMTFEKINGAGDYVQVCGMTDTYKVTLKTDGANVEILIDMDNIIKNITDTKILLKISSELAESANSNNFSEWCGTLHGYDKNQLEDKKWSYLWRRYHYLLAIRYELEKIFVPGDIALLEEFWFEYIRGSYGSDPI